MQSKRSEFEDHTISTRGYFTATRIRKHEPMNKRGMSQNQPSEQDVAKYWAGRNKTPRLSKEMMQSISSALRMPYPWNTLSLDIETTGKMGQKLRVGYAQYRGCSIDEAVDKYRAGTLTPHDARKLVRAYFILPDKDAPEYQQEAEESCRTYAALHAGHEEYENAEILVMHVSEFITTIFYPFVYYGRVPGASAKNWSRCRILGHHLSFDIAGLSHNWREGGDDYRGGFSMQMCRCTLKRGKWKCSAHPFIRFKNISRTKTLYTFQTVSYQNRNGQVRKNDYVGIFQDTATLGAALNETRSAKLQKLAELFGLPGKAEKPESWDAPIDATFLDYLVRDVQLTFQLFCRELELLALMGITERPEQIFSNASMDKRLRASMGLEKHYVKKWGIPDEIMGYAQVTYHGGRSEVTYRLAPLRGMQLDFTGLYLAIHGLMRMTDLWVAGNVTADEIPPDAVSNLLSHPQLLDSLFEKATWPQLRCIVQLENVTEDKPAILPVRTDYGGNTLNEGTPYVAFEGGMWWTLADVVASVLMTGTIPPIRRVIRFTPHGVANGRARFKSIQLRIPDTDIVVTLDPSDPSTDIYIQMAIARYQSKQRAEDKTLSVETCATINSLAQGLKLDANAGSYGVSEEFRIKTRSKNIWSITIHALHETRRLGNRFDEPGPYMAGPIGTLIPAAARLMLMMIERMADDKNLIRALADTDSTFIGTDSDRDVLPDIMNIVEEFNRISPYPSNLISNFLKIEDVNYELVDTSTTPWAYGNKQNFRKVRDEKVLAPLYALCVSSKRYCLFNILPDGRPLLRKVSAHGLGQWDYGGYYDKPDKWPKDIPWTEHKCSDWIFILYYYFVETALAGHYRDGTPLTNNQYHPKLSGDPLMAEPAYEPAAIRQARDLRQYKGFLEFLRPGAFFTKYPSLNPSIPQNFMVSDKVNSPQDVRDKLSRGEIYLQDGTPLPPDIPLVTLGEALDTYFMHPEFKAANGTEVGLMRRRSIHALPDIDITGKAVNKVAMQLDDESAILNTNNVTDYYRYTTQSERGRKRTKRKYSPMYSSGDQLELASLFEDHSVSDILLASSDLARSTIYNMKHKSGVGMLRAGESSVSSLVRAFNWLNPERENGGTLYHWRDQLGAKGISMERLAQILHIDLKQMYRLWAGQMTWPRKLRTHVWQLLGFIPYQDC